MRLSERLASRPAVPAVSVRHWQSLQKALQRVRLRWPDIDAHVEQAEREALIADLARRIKTRDWSGWRTSHVNRAAFALFDAQFRARGEFDNLRQWYFREVRASTRRGLLSAAMKLYLATFDPQAPHTLALAESLRMAQSRLPLRVRRLLDRIPELLTPAKAPDAVAERMVPMDDPYRGLKALGLAAPHGPGLMDHVHLAYLRQVGPELSTLRGVERLLGWLKPAGQQPRQSGAADAISALLRPWIRRDAPEDIKTRLVRALTDFYNDPRTRPGGVWVNVDPDCRAVFLRWLTGASLKFLFEVLDESQDSHMWEERHRFWWDQYQRGNIKAAWVAFGEEGWRIACRRFGGAPPYPFGRQVSDSGDDRNKSLLIMQIGERIIIDGTHNFKVHIYAVNYAHAPKLYLREYDCSKIRRDRTITVEGQRVTIGPVERKVHLGNWQFDLRYRYPELS